MPLATEIHTIDDGGVEFVVRVAREWPRKPSGSDAAATAGAGEDPFLPPYEPDLFVTDLTVTHAVLLNKFPVLADHLLLVTRHYESQTAPLTVADFEAMLTALSLVDGLAFYNGGREAGASQPHRHLQLVPLPLGPGSRCLPVEPWFESVPMNGATAVNPDLPFPHAFAPMPAEWLEEPAASAPAARALYWALWTRLGHEADGTDQQPMPFNLLATRQWIWLVPRRREGVAGLSVNALGFAGGLLAGDEQRYERLREIGPLNLLARV